MNDVTLRLHLLHEVLRETSGTNYFTVVERIFINQERGYLFSLDSEDKLRPYTVSESIEEKINKLIQ